MTNTFANHMNGDDKITYNLTNNYMFHVILQTNELVLRGLISALLHLPLDEIHTIEIKNPIKLGEAIDMKEFILDVYIQLNNLTELNLEMQVNNLHNWPDRSLSYLCRTFDGLCSGQDYRLTKPVIHIGILDFSLFPEHPEFYASYKLLNVKNHEIFNDKFILNVLSLKQIELATEEDKEWQLDIWAKFFLAKTWEAINMIAKNNEILTSATESLQRYNSDWLIRERCRAREDYERHEFLTQQEKERQAAIIQEQNAALADKDTIIQKQSIELAEKDALILEHETIIQRQDEEIAFLKAQLTQKNNQ